MKRPMIFNYMYWDARHVGNQRTIKFFTETDEDDESVTTLSEEAAIHWLFNNPHFFEMFADGFFGYYTGVEKYFGLKEPFTNQNKKPGDIDLLLLDKEKPHQAIAFECKKVKAITIDEHISKVNNIEKIRKGILQVNQYQSLGFYQSYLLIILLDDGRYKKTPNQMFRAHKEDVERIYDIPWNENLNSDVGVVYVKVNQTTGRHINFTGGFGFCIDKPAQKLEQTASMTNKVKELIKQNH